MSTKYTRQYFFETNLKDLVKKHGARKMEIIRALHSITVFIDSSTNDQTLQVNMHRMAMVLLNEVCAHNKWNPLSVTRVMQDISEMWELSKIEEVVRENNFIRETDMNGWHDFIRVCHL